MEDFDPKCTWFITGLYAIWVAYRWGMWEELRQVGLPKEEFLPKFQDFEDRIVLGRRGFLRSPAQALQLMGLDKRIQNAAGRLTGYYIMLYGVENPAVLKEKRRGTIGNVPYKDKF